MAGDAMSNSSQPTTSGDEALAGFLDKWRARWPEWHLAEVFLAPAERPVALAWASLQQELLDAAWGGTDARPGEAKLLWWQEELLGWSQGRRRHPLGQVLQRLPAPWATLGRSLATLPASRERAQNAADAFAALEPIASAAAEVESALFGGSTHVPPAISATWLAARALQADESAVPLQALARAGQGAGADEWRRELADRWPATGGAARVRRLWCALARGRLARPQGDPPPAWRVLWSAWRAARN